MSRTNQRLINYHGSVLDNLIDGKDNLYKGEIAVIHTDDAKTSFLAIKDNVGDAVKGTNIILFASSAAVYTTIQELSAGTIADINAEYSRAKGVEDKLRDDLEVVSGGLLTLSAATVAFSAATVEALSALSQAARTEIKAYDDSDDEAQDTTEHLLITSARAEDAHDIYTIKLIDIASQTDLDTEIGARQAADTAIIGGASEAGNTLKKLEDRVATNEGKLTGITTTVTGYVKTQIDNLNATVTDSGSNVAVQVVESSGVLTSIIVDDEALETRLDDDETTLADHESRIQAEEQATERQDDEIKNLSALTYVALGFADGTYASYSSGHSLSDIAADAVARVLSGAPQAFDTLKEISEWIIKDYEGATRPAEFSGATALDMLSDIIELSATTRALDSALATETSQRTDEDTRLNNLITGETARAEDAEEYISGAVSTLSAATVEGLKKATTEVKEGTDEGNNMTIVKTTDGTDGHSIYTVNLTDVASKAALEQEISDARAGEKAAHTVVNTTVQGNTNDHLTIAKQVDATDGHDTYSFTLKDVASSGQLQTTINELADEVTRATNAESAISSATNTQVARLDQKIEDETSRATLAETGLGNRITPFESNPLATVNFGDLDGTKINEHDSGVRASVTGSGVTTTITFDFDSLVIDCGDF